MQVPLVWRGVCSSPLVNVGAAAAQSTELYKGVCKGQKGYSQMPRSPELVCRSQARLLQSRCRPLCPGGTVKPATGLSPGCRESSSRPSLLLLAVTQLAVLPCQGILVPCSCVARLSGMAGRQYHQTAFRAGKPQKATGRRERENSGSRD